MNAIFKAIRANIANTWVERFPNNHAIKYPKSLIKCISNTIIIEKDNNLDHYELRMEIQYFDKVFSNFSSKETEIINKVYQIEGVLDVTFVTHIGTDFGYDPNEEVHVLSIEFIIEYAI